MAEEPFTNRELKQMFSELHAKIDKILAQTTKTNGRVNNLELWKARLEGAGWLAKIGWSLISIFIIAACFALFKMYIQFQSIDEKINNAVASQLDDYKFNK